MIVVMNGAMLRAVGYLIFLKVMFGCVLLDVSSGCRVCNLHHAVDSVFPEKCSEFTYNGT